jgi:metal-sulfur cluster biosynthetic enzyme
MNPERIRGALRQVIDPELGVNVVDLGLVYNVEQRERTVRVAMTMTTRACPLGAYLTEAAEAAVKAADPDVEAVEVDMVWDPPWEPAMMTPEAKRQLGWRD